MSVKEGIAFFCPNCKKRVEGWLEYRVILPAEPPRACYLVDWGKPIGCPWVIATGQGANCEDCKYSRPPAVVE